MFCDLVGSTALSAQLDPEELREVVRAYQETCTDVIQRYEGILPSTWAMGCWSTSAIPRRMKMMPQRAVRTGLEIVAGLQLNAQLPHATGRLTAPLQVRIGIHTGLVVVGEIGQQREARDLGAWARRRTLRLASRGKPRPMK